VTHAWINELDELLGWGDKTRTYRMLRTVLQALRDWLPADESANFAAQLPIVLRGIYYEHWRPATTPVKQRSKADFVARIGAAFARDPLLYTEEAVSIAFRFLTSKVTAGEVADVYHALPADLRALWPISPKAA
jgi:uncharacterized protein (DUF2267 family)